MRRPPALAIVAAAVVVVLVFAENIFGRQLNAAFLRYPGIDKILHFIEYGVIALLARQLAAAAGVPERWRTAAAWCAAVGLSIADETMQQFGPGRSVEILDVAANACGATFAMAMRAGGRTPWAVAAAALLAGAAVTYDTHVKLLEFARGMEYERTHRFGLARMHYQRALESGLRTPVLFNSLSWVEVESGEGDPHRAVEYAETALGMRPNDPDFLDTYGWALHAAGRSADALPPLQEAFARKPKMYCINYHLGAVYLALGRRDLAEAHFRRQVAMTATREAPLAARALEQMAVHR